MTSNRYDFSGNTRTTSRTVQRYLISDAWQTATKGTEWTWNAYAADERLRVTQRSFWEDSVHMRTAFMEYRYDALGRRVLTRTRWDQFCAPSISPLQRCLSTIDRTVWDGDQILSDLRNFALRPVTNDSIPSACLPDWDVRDEECRPTSETQDLTFTQDGTALESEYTYGRFAGWVRYTHAGGIDQPLAVWKSELNAGIVPHRSWRGTYEAGSFLGVPNSNVSWPGRGQDVFHAPDARQTVIEPSHWLGSVIDGPVNSSGLTYQRNRYYDPKAGRFTQEDPIGLAGGMNLYGFAGGDPVNFSDPFGLCKKGSQGASAHGEGNNTVIECNDGTDEVRAGGTRAWRNNNSGNLENGAFSKRHGSIGGAGGAKNSFFAVFPDEETGADAHEALLNGPTYQGKSIDGTIESYAPASHGNNTAAYQAAARKAVGVGGSVKLSDLTGAQMQKLMTIIRRVEGWQEGSVTYRPHP